MVQNMAINPNLIEQLQQIALLQNITANALAEKIIAEYIEDRLDYLDAAKAYEEYKKNPVSLSCKEICDIYEVD